MRLISLLLDGFAGTALPGLLHGTALASARAPGLTALAERGRTGWLDAPAALVENFRPECLWAALLGWPLDRARQFRRGPLEARGAGPWSEAAGPRAWSGTLVTLDDDGDVLESQAPGLSESETAMLVESMNPALAPLGAEMRAGGAGRVVVRGPRGEGKPSDPGPVRLGDPLPEGASRDRFPAQVAAAVRPALDGHMVNQVRIDLSENPVHGIWMWGEGDLEAQAELIRVELEESRVVVLTNSPVGRGLAAGMGWPWLDLEAPWEGRLDGHPFHVPEVVGALRTARHLAVWLEAPRDGGAYGDAEDTVWALERLDQHVVRPLADLMEASRPCRMLAVAGPAADTGDRSRLPVLVAGDGVLADRVAHWDETAVQDGALGRTGLERLLNFTWDR